MKASDIRHIKAAAPANSSSAWELKTANFNAVAGGKYLCDTTASGDAEATLPAAPSVSDEIEFVDAQGNFYVSNLVIVRNGKKIAGIASDLICNENNQAFKLVYVGGSLEWQIIRFQ